MIFYPLRFRLDHRALAAFRAICFRRLAEIVFIRALADFRPMAAKYSDSFLSIIICIVVASGTQISWFTLENGSGFIATFGVPHPFTRTPASAAIFHGSVGQPDSDTASGAPHVIDCYQYNLEHSINGRKKFADPKVIVNGVGLDGAPEAVKK